MPYRKNKSRHGNSSALPSVTQSARFQELKPVERISYFGIPRFDWSLTLFGFCVFTFVIVTYKVNFAVVGVVIGVVGLFVGRDRVRVPFPVWLYLAFLLWAFVASFASPYPEIAREQLVDRLKLFVIMLIAVNALRTEGQLRFYLLFFIVCYILFPVRGAIVNYLVGNHPFGRAIWNYIYSNPNDLAALSLNALGVALGMSLSEPSRILVSFGAGISCMLLVMVILMTQSRGAFLGVAIAISPLLIQTLKKTPRAAITLVVAILIIGFSVPEGVWNRLSGMKKLMSTSTIYEADSEGSAEQRFEILKVAWNIVLDHPVFGVGIGAYKLANARYAPDLGKKDTHNTYLNLAAELGLPGLMLWCALVGSVLRYSYRRRRHAQMKELAVQESGIWWGFIGYLVAGIFGSYAALTFPYLILAVLWCSGSIHATTEVPAGNRIQTSGKT